MATRPYAYSGSDHANVNLELNLYTWRYNSKIISFLEDRIFKTFPHCQKGNDIKCSYDNERNSITWTKIHYLYFIVIGTLKMLNYATFASFSFFILVTCRLLPV